MAEVFCKDVCLWIKDVGCRQTRVVLLALEPGSKVWLSVDGDAILFERMADGSDGRSTRGLRPVSPTGNKWLTRYKEEKGALLEFDFVERPLDSQKAGASYYQREPEP